MSTPLAPLPPLPGRSRRRAPRPCGCGCGRLTRGGSFVPGDDARRLGWAVRLWRGLPVDGISAGERAAALAWIRSGAAALAWPDRFAGDPAPGVAAELEQSA